VEEMQKNLNLVQGLLMFLGRILLKRYERLSVSTTEYRNSDASGGRIDFGNKIAHQLWGFHFVGKRVSRRVQQALFMWKLVTLAIGKFHNLTAQLGRYLESTW
jgi:hypothetical protein